MINNSLPMAGYNGMLQSKHVTGLISDIDWDSKAGEELRITTVEALEAKEPLERENIRYKFMRLLELKEGK